MKSFERPLPPEHYYEPLKTNLHLPDLALKTQSDLVTSETNNIVDEFAEKCGKYSDRTIYEPMSPLEKNGKQTHNLLPINQLITQLFGTKGSILRKTTQKVFYFVL